LARFHFTKVVPDMPMTLASIKYSVKSHWFHHNVTKSVGKPTEFFWNTLHLQSRCRRVNVIIVIVREW
jgi:hypothetical protein